MRIHRYKEIHFILFALFFWFIPEFVSAQSEQTNNRLLMTEKKVQTTNDNGGHSESKILAGNNSGVVVMQNGNGIIYKSLLMDFGNIRVELLKRSGEIMYEYIDSMTRNEDYMISLNQIPVGEYIFRLEYGNKLIICNLQVSGQG